MPVSLKELDESSNPNPIKIVCRELNLDEAKCELLQSRFKELCGGKRRKTRTTGPRAVSKWQQCIKARRAGKKFDPAAIRQLAIEYKAGKCP